MARTNKLRRLAISNWGEPTLEVRPVDPDSLKNLVREGLTSQTVEDREAFFGALENEFRSLNINVRAYLVPLGISARSPEELTPGDIGHLVRYLKINLPGSGDVIDGVIDRFGLRADKKDDLLAA